MPNLSEHPIYPRKCISPCCSMRVSAYTDAIRQLKMSDNLQKFFISVTQEIKHAQTL